MNLAGEATGGAANGNQWEITSLLLGVVRLFSWRNPAEISPLGKSCPLGVVCVCIDFWLKYMEMFLGT